MFKSSNDPPRAVIVLNVVAAGQAAGGDTLGAGGVNHFPVANVDAHMGNTCAVCILKEYEIAGLQIALCHIGANLVLLCGGSGKLNAAKVHYILGKT